MKAIHELYVPASGLELLILPVHMTAFKAHMNELGIKFFFIKTHDIEDLAKEFKDLELDITLITSDKYMYDLYNMITIRQRKSLKHFQTVITRSEASMLKVQNTDFNLLSMYYDEINKDLE